MYYLILNLNEDTQIPHLGWITTINLRFSLSQFYFTSMVPFAKKWELKNFYTRVLVNNLAFLFLWNVVIQTKPAQTNSDTDTISLQTKSISLMGNTEA